LLIAILAGLVGACGQPAAPPLQIVKAVATSQSSVLVTFDSAVDEAALVADDFQVTGPGATRLTVLAVYPQPGGTAVVLATEPQQLVTYSLVARNVVVAGAAPVKRELQAGFEGSGATAPVVAHAVPLSNSSVLVTFVDPVTGKGSDMGPGALLSAHYLIGLPDLDITAAAFGANGVDRSRAVLTTGSQADRLYTLQVTNVLSATGDRLVDPFLNGGAFRGIAVEDQVGPQVLEVYASSNTTLFLRFSEPLTGA